MRGKLLLAWAFALGHALAASAYTPANAVVVAAEVVSSFDPQTGQYRYDYVFRSQPTSALEVATILIPLHGAAVTALTAPAGWTAGYSAVHDWVSFDAAELNLPPDYVDDGSIPPSAVQIKPGQSLGGFSIQSPNPPGPIFFHAQGFTQLPVLDVDVVEDTAPGVRAVGPLDPSRSFRASTSGPVRAAPGEPVILTYFLHGAPRYANPEVRFLNPIVPTETAAKYVESDLIRFPNGNPWVPVGQWVGSGILPLGTLTGSGPLQIWLGLKNRLDERAAFDIKADVLKNGAIVATGTIQCVTGIVHRRDPADASLAKEIVVPLSVPQLVGVARGDALEVHVSARVGTRADGTMCAAGGTGSVRGLLAYFDAAGHPARFTLEF